MLFVVFVNPIFFASVKIHELSEFKDISNVVELEDETKGEMTAGSQVTVKGQCGTHTHTPLHPFLTPFIQV